MYVCSWRVWWHTCFADIVIVIDSETCHTRTFWSYLLEAGASLHWCGRPKSTRHLFLLFFLKEHVVRCIGISTAAVAWLKSEILSFVSDSDLISHFRGVRCLTILYGKSHDVEWNAWICCALEVEMSWYSQKPNLYVTVWNCMYLYVTACNCM